MLTTPPKGGEIHCPPTSGPSLREVVSPPELLRLHGLTSAPRRRTSLGVDGSRRRQETQNTKTPRYAEVLVFSVGAERFTRFAPRIALHCVPGRVLSRNRSPRWTCVQLACERFHSRSTVRCYAPKTKTLKPPLRGGFSVFRRGGEIRTLDLTIPNRARYQTALRPDGSGHGLPGQGAREWCA